MIRVQFHVVSMVMLKILLFTLPAFNAQAVQIPLFEDDSPIEIELTGPIWSLVDQREEQKEWPFRLKTQTLELDLKVRARGNSRLRVCAFPPLRLNFKKSELSGTLFEGQDKLKLVTPCKKSDRSKADVVEEYAAYRIFSLLTDVSFRVRLVNITYNDTDGRLNENFRQSYGFLIEPVDQLVARAGGSLTEIPAVSLRSIDAEQAALVYVYQYLIANTDWSFVAPESDESCCHNVRLIKIGDKQFPVPYDFDLAGLVNADYAHPDPTLRIKKVTMRLYRGFCTAPDVLRSALTAITSKEDEVNGVINKLPQLTEKEKAQRIKYMGRFFRKADDKDQIIRSFEKRCHE